MPMIFPCVSCSSTSSFVRTICGAPRFRSRYITMTSTPQRYQTWHPSRGISFSPEPSRSPTNVPKPRSVDDSTVPQGLPEGGRPSNADRWDLKHDVTRAVGEPATAGAVAYPVLPQVTDVPNAEIETDDVPTVVALKESEEKIIDPASNNPPFAALEYKMSEELFREAKRAAPGSPESFWSYSLYRGPGDNKPKVHYCRSKHTAERVCKEYFASEKLLGFDLEWAADSPRSAGPRRNVSLIQLASPSRIALFHVAVFSKGEDLVVPTFKKIMEDSSVTKVGVWIKGDATRLRTHLGIDSEGLMELSHLYRLVTYSRTGQFANINKRLVPLATQVEQCLHLPMFKGQDVRSSDWTQPLNMKQVTYSASDAYAGVHLYATLEHYRKQLDPCPPSPHHAELNLPIRLSDGLDLETESDDEAAEAPVEEVLSPTGTLSPEARRRALIAHLKGFKSTAAQITKTLRQAEDILDAVIARDPRVERADTWAKAFLAENYPSDAATKLAKNAQTDGVVKFAELRAYRLWHSNKELTTADVAALLRNPPLKTTTVATYISNAVKLERLPVDDSRYSEEILKAAIGKFTRCIKRPIPSATT